MRLIPALCLLIAMADSLHAQQADPPPPVSPSVEEIEKAYAGQTPPESVKMLLAIMKGTMRSTRDGWFGPAQQRYGWQWLAERHGLSPEAGLDEKTFLGKPDWFRRLDRDRNGRVTPQDLDWSEESPWVQRASQLYRLFRRIESSGDGKLTREEWIAFFDKAVKDQPELTSDDFRDAMLGVGSAGSLGEMPPQDVMLRSLFANELGSLHEGPKLNEAAPDFTLKTHDGRSTVRLADLIGKKPVVLTFGNYTCGPFRATFAGVDQVHKRFKDEAEFLLVYVREAHPTDGWRMESNDQVSVSLPQPKTYGERAGVATRCQAFLQPAMPLLVDEITDPVGNAYSGMPSRMYVIDRAGKIAYKSGRGPFGFKVGEMEQALAMALLEDK
jgi:hypothetical protein